MAGPGGLWRVTWRSEPAKLASLDRVRAQAQTERARPELAQTERARPEFAQTERARPEDTAALSDFARAAFVATFGALYHRDDLAAFLAHWNTPSVLAEQINSKEWHIAIVRNRQEQEREQWKNSACEQSDSIIGFIKLGPCTLDLSEADLSESDLRALAVSESDSARRGPAKPRQPSANKQKIIELHQLYLAESAKGSGIADTLMQWGLERALRASATSLLLSVFSENPRAQAFYRRYGFVDRGRHAFYVGNHIDEDRIWRLDL